jgi:hypothetical protein
MTVVSGKKRLQTYHYFSMSPGIIVDSEYSLFQTLINASEQKTNSYWGVENVGFFAALSRKVD